MLEFKDFSTMTEARNQGGLDYELKVHNALVKSKIYGLVAGDKPGAGFSNQGAGDIEATLFGKPFNIEIKASANDQMGGTSFRYDKSSKVFTPAKSMDADDLDLLNSAAQTKVADIDAFIAKAEEYDNKLFDGFPITVTKETRTKLKTDGLQKRIATNISTSAKFIAKHYNKKSVYYIQVGGAGLFYMGSNPLKLPVPELKGDIQIEMRVGYAGSGGRPVVSAGLRLQGRLKTKNKSSYSLDNEESIQKMFAEL